MEVGRLSLILALANVILQDQMATGSGQLHVRLVRYDNPQGKGANGHCCDGRSIFCERRGCDQYFHLCLDSYQGTDNIASCSLGSITTGVTLDHDNIIFGSHIAGTRNPIVVRFETWSTPGMKVKVNVWDDDSGVNSHDFVDFLKRQLTIRPARDVASANEMPVTLQSRTTLRIALKVFCNADWFGEDCGTFCQPRDQASGHYNCHPDTGSKICHQGWSGPECTTDTDECSSSPCTHRGTCQDQLDGFMCVCPAGFNGYLCEVDVDECASNPCPGGLDQCADLHDGYQCLECPPGWTGAQCETEVHPCDDSPCAHAYNCTNDIDTYRCACLDGWRGKDCNTTIDLGDDDIDGGVEYNMTTCVNQEHRVDRCMSRNACEDGGKCLDLDLGYECTLLQGARSAAMLDESRCSYVTCSRNLTCEVTRTGYRCLCPISRTCIHGQDRACETPTPDPHSYAGFELGGLEADLLPGEFTTIRFTGRLSDDDIDQVTAFVQSLATTAMEMSYPGNVSLHISLDQCFGEEKQEVTVYMFSLYYNNLRLRSSYVDTLLSDAEADDNSALPFPRYIGEQCDRTFLHPIISQKRDWLSENWHILLAVGILLLLIIALTCAAIYVFRGRHKGSVTIQRSSASSIFYKNPLHVPASPSCTQDHPLESDVYPFHIPASPSGTQERQPEQETAPQFFENAIYGRPCTPAVDNIYSDVGDGGQLYSEIGHI